MSHAPITCENWCPRKDSNLQPLVCRTSAQSVELLGQRDWRSELESNQPFWLFRPALIHLSYPTAYGPQRVSRGPLKLALAPHTVHHVAIVVHVHEQVLAPFSSRFCIVAKHNAFELHAQCRLRSKQRHSCFRRRAIALSAVALKTNRDEIQRRGISTTPTRQHVTQPHPRH